MENTPSEKFVNELAEMIKQKGLTPEVELSNHVDIRDHEIKVGDNISVVIESDQNSPEAYVLYRKGHNRITMPSTRSKSILLSQVIKFSNQ